MAVDPNGLFIMKKEYSLNKYVYMVVADKIILEYSPLLKWVYTDGIIFPLQGTETEIVLFSKNIREVWWTNVCYGKKRKEAVGK